jgi:PAS domain S-box-containing protein
MAQALSTADPALAQLASALAERPGPRLSPEAQLRKAEARYRALVEHIPAVTFLASLDADAHELYVSPQIESLLGFSQEEWLANPILWYTQLHPDDRSRWHDEFARTCATGVEFYSEYRFLARDGRVVWVHGEAKVVRDDAGRPLFIQGIAFDITERKRAEEALQRMNDELETLVEARTAQLANANAALRVEIAERGRLQEALRQRAEQLAAEGRRKDEFLAMLAHELRNPLAPIRNAAQILRLVAPAHPAMCRAEDTIERQVAHMARLIDDLLDVSRISRGKILLRREPLDLAPLVRQAVADYRPLMEQAGLRLAVELPGQPLWLSGDPTRLAQVVSNLLHNANKFCDAGGLVTVRLWAEPDARTAVLSVGDTGIGMGPDILARLFEPFSQADRSLDRSRGGLGLGLALVKGLVELHGGTVAAASPGEGAGSELTVRLPLKPELAPIDQAQDRAGPPGGRALRILLIEDGVDAADTLRYLLEMAGHRVEVARTGPAGLEAARRWPPDLVLCDLALPGGMDGYEVARALRAAPPRLPIRLVALSGSGQHEDQRRAYQAGFDQRLTKPIDSWTLSHLIEDVVGRGRPRKGRMRE